MSHTRSGKTNKVEAEIERCREDSNWKRSIELAEQMKTNRSYSQTLSNFLIGEGKLELYLEEHPPIEANVPRAKKDLLEAKKYLDLCVLDNNKKAEVSLDALLLLAKLEFGRGNYQIVVEHLDKAGLQQLAEIMLPTRSLKIISEAYAVKGLCLEKLPIINSSSSRLSERLEKILHCFKVASDLALVYLQEQDKLVSISSTQSLPSVAASANTGGSTSPCPPNGDESKKVGVLLETVLQRIPVLLMKEGKTDAAIDFYRNLLMAVEVNSTKRIRLTMARQLAEVLFRKFSDDNYRQPVSTGKSESMKTSEESPWKPRKYAGNAIFSPNNINEEIILLLFISEALAGREAVLSQYPEFTTARTHAYNNATAVHDLLCLTLARRKQFQVLAEMFERSMKFSFEASHVWQQFGLTVACTKHFVRAQKVLQEAHRLLPGQPHNCLIAARICFQHLGQVDEGINWVNKAIASLEKSSRDDTESGYEGGNNSVLAARCYLFQGLGFTLRAMHSHRLNNTKDWKAKALEAFIRAQQIDAADHLIEYYLAFHHATNKQLIEATQHVKLALQLRPEHPPSLLLLVLLLSSQRQHDEALQLCNAVVEEYPEHLQLLYVKACLEEHLDGPEASLLTTRRMLALWNSLYKEEVDDISLESPTQAISNHDTYSVFNMSDKDTVSIHAESVAASRVEAALSEVASSLSSYNPKKGPQQAWVLQIQIWLLAVQLYLKTDQLSEASRCIQEASSIFPLSHHIIFMQGQLHEKKHEFQEAILCYRNALSINPFHTGSLRHLGIIQHYLGRDRLSEKNLLDAIKIDPFDHLSWSALGDTISSLGQLEASSRCFATALDIEVSSPILPYSSIPLCFE